MTCSQITANCKAYELCFYWEDNAGIETIDGLYRWESADSGNRKLFKVDSREKAIEITNSSKKLKTYI